MKRLVTKQDSVKKEAVIKLREFIKNLSNKELLMLRDYKILADYGSGYANKSAAGMYDILRSPQRVSVYTERGGGVKFASRAPYGRIAWWSIPAVAFTKKGKNLWVSAVKLDIEKGKRALSTQADLCIKESLKAIARTDPKKASKIKSIMKGDL